MTLQKDSSTIRIVLAGSVGSSKVTLQSLLKHNINVVGVLGLNEKASKNVSGFTSLKEIAQSSSIQYYDFEKINESSVIEKVREWQPDLFFVVGLSQLVCEELLSIPKIGSIGFHPTKLPKGRGRAPLAWLTYKKEDGASTFFLMNNEVDSGPILVQETFCVNEQDYASNVKRNLEEAISRALDRWLPKLLRGEWNIKKQDDTEASYYGRRTPSDGLIDWNKSAKDILRLIQAASKPHPGAYTFIKDYKIKIWYAEIAKYENYTGIPGRILKKENDRLLVPTGEGLLWLTDYELETPFEKYYSIRDVIRVGAKLGYYSDYEIYKLKKRIKYLESKILVLEGIVGGKNE